MLPEDLRRFLPSFYRAAGLAKKAVRAIGKHACLIWCFGVVTLSCSIVDYAILSG